MLYNDGSSSASNGAFWAHPTPQMGHQDDSPPSAFRRRDNMLPPLVRRRQIIAFRQAKPVQKDVNKMVVLPPGAPEGMAAPPVREESAVEADADGYTPGKQ